ncbi:hypothetical protein L0222_18270 [bacterium]|nr:hypothetical protein [bacterium]MCI0605902.1 hypothetical protein [bacterium]
MRVLRLSLYLGGLFNLTMGCIFLSNGLLEWFFLSAMALEKNIFGREVTLIFPSDPLHRLLIHGFGAGVLILGATLLYSAKDPRRLVSFIFFDGAGRLLFSVLMFYYVLTFSLPRTILIFGAVEFVLALIYIWGSVKSAKAMSHE